MKPERKRQVACLIRWDGPHMGLGGRPSVSYSERRDEANPKSAIAGWHDHVEQGVRVIGHGVAAPR